MFPGIPIPDGERFAKLCVFLIFLHLHLKHTLFLLITCLHCSCCSRTYVATHTRMLIRHCFVLVMRQGLVTPQRCTWCCTWCVHVWSTMYMCHCDAHVTFVHVLRTTLTCVYVASVYVCVLQFVMRMQVTPHTNPHLHMGAFCLRSLFHNFARLLAINFGVWFICGCDRALWPAVSVQFFEMVFVRSMHSMPSIRSIRRCARCARCAWSARCARCSRSARCARSARRARCALSL